ncbi:flavodoxin [Ruminococcaceae bacterium OttesenSCG-928-A16]|nr:flavodoxin [Ruminococcaceae bacterium OttesenSCG-928-A16]
MNIEVRYFTRGGNTKKLADTIAQAAGVTAKPISTPVEIETDLLFLGASVYAAGVDAAMHAFINTLNPQLVHKVAVFSTAAIKKSAYPQVQKLLNTKGISVLEKEFCCRGQFAMLHRGRPNAQDLAQAFAFAKDIIEKGV